MKTLQTKLLASLVIAGLLVVATLFALSFRSERAQGSVMQFSEYQATSTKDQLGNTIADLNVISSTQGTLGSVVITGANTGTFILYDATTTDATQRTNTATTVLAAFPTNTAANTYTFDIIFKYGMILDYVTNMATATITWRPR